MFFSNLNESFYNDRIIKYYLISVLKKINKIEILDLTFSFSDVFFISPDQNTSFYIPKLQ